MSAATEQRPPAKATEDSATAPPGYKWTEVGVIPESWSVEPLLKALRLPTGQVDPRWEPYASMTLVAPDHVEGATGRLLVRQTAKAQGAISGKYPFTVGDIVYSKIRPYLRKAILADFDGLCSADMYPLSPATGVSPGFMLAVLLGNRFSVFAESVSARSGIPKINREELAGFYVALPPEPEQRAIAEALSDVDKLLGALEALIAKKRAIKQAAMQELLTGKTRLPGFSGEWETKRLGDLADIHNGATPSTQVPAHWDGDIPWCTPTDITGTPGKYLTSTERRITRQGLASCAASLLPRGALLLCSRATVGELKIATTPICTNQGFKSLVCKRGTSNEFLYYLLLTLKPALLERSSGSTFLEIGKRDVASLQALFPTEEEQTAIATVLSDMDAEIAALEARRDKTCGIKQGMMQQLLTGRVRLVKPEAAPAC